MIGCLHPLAPNDEELLQSALDGDALSAAATTHLEQCPTCQQRRARYKHAHAILVSHLYRSRCPASITLSLYCADLLPPGERLSVANHLQVCPLCAAEAVDARQFLAEPFAMTGASTMTGASPSITGASPSMTGASPSMTGASPVTTILRSAVRRILATPVKQQTQLVVRADPSEAAWPRQYRADSLNLSLHLSRASSGKYTLLIIISGPTEAIETFTGFMAELYPAPGGKDTNRAEKPLLSEQLDDLGNIVFSQVPVGEYVMIVYLPERELVIEGVIIQPG